MSQEQRLWRLGTRASPLARAQADEADRRLRDLEPELATRIVPLSTRGDAIQDRSLADVGGKGLFTKELDEALLDGRIDLAVHSMKDVPTAPPRGIVIVAVLPREDPRDAFISHKAASLMDLPAGAVVGVSSLRRQAQTLAQRPDLTIAPMRGSVETRLRKIGDGAADATYLAMAGLNRLGKSELATRPLEPGEMLPAAAQGAICIAAREEDQEAAALAQAIGCDLTKRRVAAERAFLAALDGSCQTPIAALTEVASDRLMFRGELLSSDGAQRWSAEAEAPSAATEEELSELGRASAERILSQRRASRA